MLYAAECEPLIPIPLDDVRQRLGGGAGGGRIMHQNDALGLLAGLTHYIPVDGSGTGLAAHGVLGADVPVYIGVAFCSDFFFELLHQDRQQIIRWGMPVIILLSLPCVLGFNVWSGFQPFGPGSGVLELEDFLVSYNLLPLGSLVYLLFCMSRYGWGWNAFIKEANMGQCILFPTWQRAYLTWGLPLIVLAIFFNGYYALFFNK